MENFLDVVEVLSACIVVLEGGIMFLDSVLVLSSRLSSLVMSYSLWHHCPVWLHHIILSSMCPLL